MKLVNFLFEPIAKAALSVATRRPPDVELTPNKAPYLDRWFIIPRNRWFNIYLHHFMASDDDTALHDHPWWNVSLLLKGDYIEHTIKEGGVNYKKQYCARDLKFRTAKSPHRIEVNNGPSWSLFVTGPNIRNWGFHCPKRWIPWQEFVKPEKPGEIGRGCGEP